MIPRFISILLLAVAMLPLTTSAQNDDEAAIKAVIIQLAKLDGAWKITYVMDTRRKDNCIIN